METDNRAEDYSISPYDVFGKMTDSCFGIDRKGTLNSIKIRRRNNYSAGEKYIILVHEITIGRSRKNAICIEDDSVADIHAKVFYRDGRYIVEDLNSRGGTWVDGNRLNPGDESELGSRTELRVGGVTMNFQGGA